MTVFWPSEQLGNFKQISNLTPYFITITLCQQYSALSTFSKACSKCAFACEILPSISASKGAARIRVEIFVCQKFTVLKDVYITCRNTNHIHISELKESGKRMIERKWKVCSHFLPWFLVAANTYWTMNRDG